MIQQFFRQVFLHSAGHTYSNLARLFLRLFIGVMFLQLCIRQMLNFDVLAPSFSGVLGMSAQGTMAMLLAIELLCAAFIILGLLTRFAVLPPLVIMIIAEEILMGQATVSNQLFSFQPGYPVMFIGIFAFFLLAGPGKISLDYVIAAYLTDTREDNEILEEA